jgi:polyphosphate glucokinase
MDNAIDRPVVLADVGGTHVKVLTSTASERRRFDSGPDLTPQQLAAGVLELTRDWRFDVVSVGIPTPVRGGKPIAEPVNLGDGWVGFDFAGAFGKPTRVVNDALMQAVGSYEGGRMLFLGLGTGLGSAFIDGSAVEPLELGHLSYKKGTFEDYVSERALKEHGHKKWQKHVFAVVAQLTAAMEPDYVVLGGGGVDDLRELPPGARRGSNENAFLGGFRLWDESPAAVGGGPRGGGRAA